MNLRAPTKRSITLQPVRPNLGVEAAYRRKLDALVIDMNNSVLYWMSAAYKANPPAMAMDASPAAALTAMMRRLGKRWIKRFDDASKDIAAVFATQSREAAERSMKKILADVGFSVPFTQTPAMKDAFDSVLSSNVALIKSIPSQQFEKIEGAIMRSVQSGRDLKSLQTELLGLGDISKNRAAFIARDQSNKATAVMSKARRLSLGLTKAKWMHSGGGVHPRPSHVAANGKEYDVAQGCLIDGEYIMPGELPNCRCQSRAIIPGFDNE